MAAIPNPSKGKHIWASSSFLSFHAGISLSRNYSMPTSLLVRDLLQDYDPRLLPVETFGDNVSIAVNIALRQLMKLVQLYNQNMSQIKISVWEKYSQLGCKTIDKTRFLIILWISKMISRFRNKPMGRRLTCTFDLVSPWITYTLSIFCWDMLKKSC